jgi:hypothetical protein
MARRFWRTQSDASKPGSAESISAVEGAMGTAKSLDVEIPFAIRASADELID